MAVGASPPVLAVILPVPSEVVKPPALMLSALAQEKACERLIGMRLLQPERLKDFKEGRIVDLVMDLPKN